MGESLKTKFVKLDGLKTFLAAAAVAVAGVAMKFDWTTVLDNVEPGDVALGTAVVFGVLRLFTNKPPADALRELGRRLLAPKVDL